MNTIKTIGYAAYSRGATLTPYVFERRALRDNDVAMEVLYSGVCHSDLHTVRDDWGWSYYPIVPGHEIIAKVFGIGSQVTK